jgi:hypothetical protein
MEKILRLPGIKSRIVDVFQITAHKINPHTLIEVYDSDNGAWILQNPDFNAEYIIKSEEKKRFLQKPSSWPKNIESYIRLTGIILKIRLIALARLPVASINVCFIG